MRSKYIAVSLGILIVIAIILFGNLFLIRTVEVVFDNPPRGADADAVIANSKIPLRSNIFSLDEKAVSDSIESAFPNNTVHVADIERVFPNKVVIYIKERLPLFAVPDDSGQYIPTDADFQMTMPVPADEADLYSAVKVSGVFVANSFNTREFRASREAAYAFFELGFRREGVIAFISEISFLQEKVRLILRGCDTVFELSLDSEKTVGQQVKEAYGEFLTLPYQNRAAATITAG